MDRAELDRLLADPGVTWVGEVVAMRPEAVRWNLQKIAAPKLWQRGIDGSDFVVAVLDSGMQTNHPMLKGRIVEEQCYSTNDAAARLSSLCPNGKEKQIGKGAVVACTFEGCDHGTFVSSVIAGQHWNGLQGAAHGADLIVGQVFSRRRTASGPQLDGMSDDVIAALERIYSLRKTYKIAAVNLSVGYQLFQGVCDNRYPEFAAIMLRLKEAKIATIKSSGNNRSAKGVTVPGCISSAIAVGATDKADKVAAFSNHGALVRLLAPGVAIQGAVPGGSDAMTGTSVAAPHVAAAFAMLRDAKPLANVDQILRALACTGKSAERYGRFRRRIDLAEALEVLNAPPNKARIYDFNVAAEARDWETLFGGWSIVGGYYTPTASGPNRAWTTNCNVDLDIDLRFTTYPSAHAFHDFDITLLTRFSFGISQTTGCRLYSGYSVTLSIIDEPVPPPAVKGYILSINRHDAAASPTCSSEGKITRLKQFTDAPIADYPGSLKVTWRGSRLTVLVDGIEVAKVKDTTYTTGRIGVDIFKAGSIGDYAAVDRIVIRPRDEPIPSGPAAARVIGAR